MIASGLCMMGGCFAQDETSRTVDAYWVAEMVQLESPLPNTVIAEVLFCGGDSENDELRITYQADYYYDCYLIGALRPVAGNTGMLIFQGAGDFCILAQANGNSSSWNEVLGEKYTWWASGGKYKRGDEVGTLLTYNCDDSAERSFRLGSSQKHYNRKIYNEEYYNARTGVRLQWQPMAGMTGTAFFEPTTGTLAEQ